MNPSALLRLAQRLVRESSPTEDTLRRGISTAYYAIFHLLTQAAARELCGPEDEFTFAAARWFDHGTMAQVCGIFHGRNVHKEIFPGEDAFSRSPAPGEDLILVAETFVELQKARHDADYNGRQAISLTDARLKVAQAAGALDAWPRAAQDPWCKVFLLSLLIGKKINKGRLSREKRPKSETHPEGARSPASWSLLLLNPWAMRRLLP